MFYCDPCRIKLEWPDSIGFKSFGRCEMCNVSADCHDVPSSALPKPKPQDPAMEEYERLRRIDP